MTRRYRLGRYPIKGTDRTMTVTAKNGTLTFRPLYGRSNDATVVPIHDVIDAITGHAFMVDGDIATARTHRDGLVIVRDGKESIIPYRDIVEIQQGQTIIA